MNEGIITCFCLKRGLRHNLAFHQMYMEMMAYYSSRFPVGLISLLQRNIISCVDG